MHEVCRPTLSICTPRHAKNIQLSVCMPQRRKPPVILVDVRCGRWARKGGAYFARTVFLHRRLHSRRCCVSEPRNKMSREWRQRIHVLKYLTCGVANLRIKYIMGVSEPPLKHISWVTLANLYDKIYDARRQRTPMVKYIACFRQ